MWVELPTQLGAGEAQLPQPSEQPFVCGEGSESYSLSAKLSQHHRVHTGKKLYVCTSCSESFTHSLTLIAQGPSHTGKKPFACTSCDKTFSHVSHYFQHHHVHTSKRLCNCSDSSKSFSHSSVYLSKGHGLCSREEKPPVPKVIANACSECWQSFSRHLAMVWHVRTHSGERPYGCTNCVKSFRCKFNLTQHH
ncbi:zinc finger protein 883-like [Dryobates pubescens]|uniref:zinc finger protein 883-like n=1 Tax=Dryobates pubescens TaxID=118200 RepID=UPI0023B8E987|nr:zinc finger protein 883-like [Dryobates pubescens]